MAEKLPFENSLSDDENDRLLLQKYGFGQSKSSLPLKEPLINNNNIPTSKTNILPSKNLSIDDENDRLLLQKYGIGQFKNLPLEANDMENFRKLDISKINSPRNTFSIDGNDSWWDNFSYGFKLGVTDTVRGVTQMATTGDKAARAGILIKDVPGVGEIDFRSTQTLIDQQNELRRRMADPENGIWATIGYFGGAVLDPAGWLIPFGKLYNGYRTLSTLQLGEEH